MMLQAHDKGKPADIAPSALHQGLGVAVACAGLGIVVQLLMIACHESDYPMPPVQTRLLVINQQVQFSTRIKKTLEQVGGFEVASFTSAAAALDYLDRRPQHVALVDYNLKGISGVELIARLRDLQPDLAIILTPKFPASEAAVRDFDLQGAVSTSVSARELVALLRQAVTQAHDMLPDTVAAPPVRDPTQALDAVLHGVGEGSTIDIELPPRYDDPPDGPNVFEQLLASEPPMPGLEDGTIHDLRNEVADTGVRDVVEILRKHEGAPLVSPQPLPPEDSEQILAQRLLETMRDQGKPLEQVLAAAEHEIINTERMIAIATSTQAELDALSADLAHDVTPEDTTPTGDVVVPPAPPPDTPEALPADPLTRTAQIALRLTQASLELAAEATLLTRGTQIVASAGGWTPEDIAELDALIESDWAAQSGQARMRFVTLPASGRDYLLFARRTELSEDEAEDFTLTMIFAGNMPLRAIRRQCDRLLRALASVPDEALFAAEEALATDAVVGDTFTGEDQLSAESAVGDTPVMTVAPTSGLVVPYTYIWMLRTPGQRLDTIQIQALDSGLRQALAQRGWVVKALDIHDAVLCLFAEVPEETVSVDSIAQLKQLAAEAVGASEGAGLWADAHITLLPGRALTAADVARYLRLGGLLV